MKHPASIRLLSLLLACAMLALCGGVSPKAWAEEGRHTVEKELYPTYFGTLENRLSEEFPLYFLDGVTDLPYVEIEDWAELLYDLNVSYYGDEDYDLGIHYSDDTVILERENSYRLELDFQQDRLVFDDYDAFVHDSSDSTLIDLVSERGFNEYGEAQLIHRDKRLSFERYGDMLMVDLDRYGIDLIAQDDAYYLPLQTMNDFLVAPSQMNFLFNGRALLLANDNKLFDYREGEYTELAEFYYEAPTGERSDALADYSYNELCLVLDTFYGLKEPHDIGSFRQLFWQIGYDEALSGNSAADADQALKTFIDFYLDDLHSVFNEYSYLAGLNAISNSTGSSNRKIEEQTKRYRNARAAFYPDGVPDYEEIGNTAYITFDTFDSLYYGEAFYAVQEGGELPDDTIGLIIYAHDRITRPDSPIENVVLDLSNNTGGDVDAAVFVLGWLLGDAPFSVKNMATGALSTSVYRADVNLDRAFDERDTVSDKKIYCLISPVSFSCGNLVPAALKSSQMVTLLGQTSGGGSCVVQPLSTAYGTVFQISSSLRMSFLKNGSFYDIDQGVDPDFFISDPAHFYDRAALTDYINNLF